MINHKQQGDRQEQSMGFASVRCLKLIYKYFELRVLRIYNKEYFELKV